MLYAVFCLEFPQLVSSFVLHTADDVQVVARNGIRFNWSQFMCAFCEKESERDRTSARDLRKLR